jgi:hypothetical protein
MQDVGCAAGSASGVGTRGWARLRRARGQLGRGSWATERMEGKGMARPGLGQGRRRGLGSFPFSYFFSFLLSPFLKT